MGQVVSEIFAGVIIAALILCGMFSTLPFKTLPGLLDYFREEATCRQYWEGVRWKEGVRCLHCNHERVYRTARGFRCADPQCRKKFSALTGSIFENTKLPLRLWFAAIFLCTTRKKGVSSHQLSRDLGITQKTAWHLLHRIRETFQQIDATLLAGTVQADETFVGGKNKNRHWDKKVEHAQGRAFKDKTPVMGLLEQNQYEECVNPRTGKTVRRLVVPSRVRCTQMADTSSGSIQPAVRRQVAMGATLVSDEWPAYRGLAGTYSHGIVDHKRKQYVNADGLTTNAIEGFWCHLKLGLGATYHAVSRKHLQRYCTEFAFRHNHRTIADGQKFAVALSVANNTTLTYARLIQRRAA